MEPTRFNCLYGKTGVALTRPLAILVDSRATRRLCLRIAPEKRPVISIRASSEIVRNPKTISAPDFLTIACPNVGCRVPSGRCSDGDYAPCPKEHSLYLCGSFFL